MTSLEQDQSWADQKERLKERFAHLTDSDLSYEPGKSDEMFENLQTKIGISKAELAAIISGI